MNNQEGQEPISQPDQDDPDMEYVKTVSTEEFTERIEEQASDSDTEEEESDDDLERRTEYNMNLISQFLEHLKMEADIDIPEQHVLSFFDA